MTLDVPGLLTVLMTDHDPAGSQLLMRDVVPDTKTALHARPGQTSCPPRVVNRRKPCFPARSAWQGFPGLVIDTIDTIADATSDDIHTFSGTMP